ncbi:neprilysin-11-like isoform X2 [Ornithodoros turicata]
MPELADQLKVDNDAYGDGTPYHDELLHSHEGELSPDFHPTTSEKQSKSGSSDTSDVHREAARLRQAIADLNEDNKSSVYLMGGMVPIVIVLILAIPAAYLLSHTNVTYEKVCTQLSCRNDGERFKAIVDAAPVVPCRNFYTHVCSLWMEQTVLPDFAYKYSYDDQMDLRNEYVLATQLSRRFEAMRNRSSDSLHPLNVIADIYGYCNDTSHAHQGKIRETLRSIIYGVATPRSSVTQAMARVAIRYAIEPVFKFRLRSSIKGARFEFDRPSLIINPANYMTREFKVRPADTRLLHGAVKEALEFIRVPNSDQKAGLVAQIVNEIGKRAIREDLNSVAHEHGLYAFHSLGESDLIDWREYISEIVGTGIALHENTTVRIRNDWYFQNITTFIEDTAISSENLLCYIKFLLVLRFSPLLPRLGRVSEVRWRFAERFKREPRQWTACLRFVDTVMPKALSWLLYKFNTRELKGSQILSLYLTHVRILQDLVDTIDIFTGNNINMPAPARLVAHSKLTKLKKVLFFPFDRTESDIVKMYKRTRPVSRFDPLEAAADMLRQDTALHYNVQAFLQGKSSFLFREYSLSRECKYVHAENSLYIPHSLFTGASYIEGVKNIVFLAKMAFIVGRCIARMFDREGTLIDDQIEYVDWLGAYGRQRYVEMDQCVVQLYNITEKKDQFSSRSTLDEDLADLFSVPPAYHFFRRKVSEVAYPRLEYRLPGFEELSSNRIFFYSVGEALCETESPKANKLQLDFSARPPNRVRLNTMLKNFPDFGKIFRCREESPMRLDKNQICDVWPRPEKKLIEPIDVYSRDARDKVVMA